MQVNAIIKAVARNGKAINTTISHLRQSQEDKAATFGAALNALTTNTLDSVQVNEIGVTDFTPEKRVPTITLAETFRHDEVNDDYYQDILTCDTDATLIVMIKTQRDPSTGQTFAMPTVTKASTYGGYGYFKVSSTIATQIGTLQIAEVTITAPETANYTPLYHFKNYKES